MEELTLRNKTAEILSTSSDPELDMDFRAMCSAPQIKSSLYDRPLMQACQDYLNAFQHGTSLYNLDYNFKRNRNSLIVYNTETKTRKVKPLQTPQRLDLGTCITQLPNGKLFCFGNYELSGITVLIDTNGGVEMLPSGTPCDQSSCIYFNNSVYCFGGCSNKGALTLSSRFDLIRNRWIKLSPMPQAYFYCNSIIFNGNILISGKHSRNLLLYSIDIDSFSTIPYKFTAGIRKILINAERLYLIECDYRGVGDIYESEIGSYTNWSSMEKSIIYSDALQVYCLCNKAEVCIGIDGYDYFKFDLNEKRLIALKKS